jgi:hypothetical protein
VIILGLDERTGFPPGIDQPERTETGAGEHGTQL